MNKMNIRAERHPAFVTRLWVLMVVMLWSLFSHAQTESPIPSLRNNGKSVQLMVDNKPFLMIAGELHNSSSSTVAYMQPIWKKLVAGNLNTVLAAVAWQQIEPQEGKFDFTLVDSMLKEARNNQLKLVFLWFGSWKNGESSYTPDWLKKDTKRFFRVQNKEGKNIETISPFCDAAREADKKAFRALMSHLAEVDKERTVLMMQPENEVGVFQEIDFCPQALKQFEGQVPSKLIQYMVKNQKTLSTTLREQWNSNGKKTKGTWKDVFRDTPYTKEFFMAWQYASYVNEIAGAGKEVYPLPMFVNAWIIQNSQQLPGQYPNGGPVSRVLDIYKAAAENIDILSPDIYLPDFKQVVSEYIREDNPLLVPESKYEPGRAFYAFAECDALGFAIFGIDNYATKPLLAGTHQVLNDLQPLILQYQGTGKMRGFLKYKEEETTLTLGDYTFHISYNDDPAFGLIIQTAPEEYLIAGMNFKAIVSSVKKDKTAYFLQIWEGGYQDGRWIPTRLLNGDETLHNSAFMAFGTKYQDITLPGIYKIKVYTRN